MKWVLRIAGGFILFNGVFVCFAESFNWGVAMTLALGIVLLLWGLLWNKINACAHKKAVRYIRNSAVAALCAELVFVGFVAVYGSVDTVTYEEDVLIVLGAALRDEEVTPALKSRLDKALEYIDKNPDVLVVVSGGQGSYERITEAEAMYRYLTDHGVPSEQIILEDRSTSTAENMTYSKEILDKHFENPYYMLTDMAFPGQPYLVAFVTNNFHVLRSAMLAEKRGFQGATHISSELEWYNYVPCYIRETMAMVKSVIID